MLTKLQKAMIPFSLSKTEADIVNIERKTHKSTLVRDRMSVLHLLHMGFKRRKTGTFPGKIDRFEDWQAQQEAFLEKLESLVCQADRQEIDLAFGDGAHFVYGKFSSFHWGKAPKYRPSGHGRYRINAYGVYDVVTNQVHTKYNEGYIDANFMVEYLKKILGKQYHEGKESFEKSIADLLESLGGDSHQEKLRTMLKPVFQRYEKSQILGC